MLLISCPWCGPRDEREYIYGGDSIKLPLLVDSMPESMKEWHEAVHIRSNTTEQNRELWFHGSGCEAWIEVVRNTSSHEIIQTFAVGFNGSQLKP